MSRSKWKGSFLAKALIKKQNFLRKFNFKENVNIWNRNSTIPAYLIGQSVFIHTGKEFIKCEITKEKVGFKFGEFAYTRNHTKKKIKKKVKKN